MWRRCLADSKDLTVLSMVLPYWPKVPDYSRDGGRPYSNLGPLVGVFPLKSSKKRVVPRWHIIYKYM